MAATNGTNVPIFSGVPKAVDKQQALDILEATLDDITLGPKPILSSPGWGPLDMDGELTTPEQT